MRAAFRVVAKNSLKRRGGEANAAGVKTKSAANSALLEGNARRKVQKLKNVRSVTRKETDLTEIRHKREGGGEKDRGCGVPICQFWTGSKTREKFDRLWWAKLRTPMMEGVGEVEGQRSTARLGKPDGEQGAAQKTPQKNRKG